METEEWKRWCKTYGKEVLQSLLINSCRWKPFNVKHGLLQRIALETKSRKYEFGANIEIEW